MSNAGIKILLNDTVDFRTGIVWTPTKEIIEFIEAEITKLEGERYDIDPSELRTRSRQIHMWVFRTRVNDRTNRAFCDEIHALSLRDNSLRVSAAHSHSR